MQAQIAGIPWFRRDDYAAMRKVLPDRSWHPTYDDWLRTAEQGMQRLQSQGIRAVQADVHSDAFVQWCTALGIKVDSAALVRHANEVALRHLTQQSAQ